MVETIQKLLQDATFLVLNIDVMHLIVWSKIAFWLFQSTNNNNNNDDPVKLIWGIISESYFCGMFLPASGVISYPNTADRERS